MSGTSHRELRRRIARTDELHDVIGAVRALAAARLRRANEGLRAINAYSAIVSTALRETLASLAARDDAAQPISGQPTLTVAFGSQHGFVGGFNDELVAALAKLDGPVWVLGERAAALAGETNILVMRVFPMATRVAGINALVRDLVDAILSMSSLVSAVNVLYAPYRPGSTTVATRRLLPFEDARPTLSAAREPVLRYVEPEKLVARFAEEYILAELAQVAMESFASENRARLRSMDQTFENIERRLERLRKDAHRARQEEITVELLDIITGVEAQRRD